VKLQFITSGMTATVLTLLCTETSHAWSKLPLCYPYYAG